MNRIMNKTFSFSRFGRYFVYDCRRWAVNYGPTLLLMSAVPVILYTIILVYSLLFKQVWATPGETTRIITACIVIGILMLTYPASVYGFITDKRAGAAFLMLPVSRLEKFLSMILNTVVIVPMVFGIIYLILDAVICVVDGTCGGTLFSSVVDGIKVLATFAFDSGAPIHVSMLSVYLNSVLGCLYFLLGALLFKKHKILYPILILVGFNMLLSMLIGIVVTTGIFDEEMIESIGSFLENVIMDRSMMAWIVPMYNVMATIWDFVVVGGLMTAVYFRLKTIKH